MSALPDGLAAVAKTFGRGKRPTDADLDAGARTPRGLDILGAAIIEGVFVPRKIGNVQAFPVRVQRSDPRRRRPPAEDCNGFTVDGGFQSCDSRSTSHLIIMPSDGDPNDR